MQKSNDGVNPQATQIDIAYLAGLWDGEGHMSVVHHNRTGGGHQYGTRCALANTNVDIIEKAVEIIDKLNVGAHLEAQNKDSKYKTCYYIVVSRMEEVKKLAEAMLPYLSGKRAQTKLVLRFIESRLSHAKKNEKTTEEEIKLYEQLKKLNQRGASETTRETSKGEEIVHTT